MHSSSFILFVTLALVLPSYAAPIGSTYYNALISRESSLTEVDDSDAHNSRLFFAREEPFGNHPEALDLANPDHHLVRNDKRKFSFKNFAKGAVHVAEDAAPFASLLLRSETDNNEDDVDLEGSELQARSIFPSIGDAINGVEGLFGGSSASPSGSSPATQAPPAPAAAPKLRSSSSPSGSSQAHPAPPALAAAPKLRTSIANNSIKKTSPRKGGKSKATKSKSKARSNLSKREPGIGGLIKDGIKGVKKVLKAGGKDDAKAAIDKGSTVAHEANTASDAIDSGSGVVQSITGLVRKEAA